MTVRVYQSTDASAPVLTGLAGSMIAVLDGCLVNGYGSQPSMGWSKAFSATNIGVYQAAVGTRYFLRVDDAASIVTGKDCLLRAYETITGTADTGTNGFPTTSQLTNGITLNKTLSAGSTARPWCLVASDRSFYFLGAPNASLSNWAFTPATSIPAASQFFFGEILSYKSTTDSYNAFLFTNLAYSGVIGQSNFASYGSSLNGHYGARNCAGTVVSQGTAKMFSHSAVQGTSINLNQANTNTFPEITTNEAGIGCVEVLEHAVDSFISPVPVQFRGRMPGFWGGNTGSTVNGPGSVVERQGPNLTISGTGSFASRTFMPINLGFDATSTTGGVAWIELTDNWYVL